MELELQDLHGKTAVVTGATDGIGFITARELARAGCTVVLTGRNDEKMQQAMEAISRDTGNRNLIPVLADFTLLSEVNRAADDILARFDSLHILVNNAGGTFSHFELTDDGIEKTIALNHFAYYLMTAKLYPALRNAPEARIVNVASHSHYNAVLDFESFTRDKGYFIMRAYGQSKLANVLFTFELADMFAQSPIRVNCLHPGTIRTRIGEKPAMNTFHRWGWKFFSGILGLPLEVGARATLYLAATEEGGQLHGKYISNTNRMNRLLPKPMPVEPDKRAYDRALRKQLIDVTAQLSGCDIREMIRG